jgi:two-component system CheB/CheR fusion protein
VVRFENGTTAPETEAAPGPSFARDEHIQRLEHELRVTRERLQATIEELTTVNGEPAHRVQELARTDSGLKNLLESTRIATVLLATSCAS